MNDFNWTRDGVQIEDGDPMFQQSSTNIIDRVLVTTQVVLWSSDWSDFQGTFQCTVRDGIGRTSVATINISGKIADTKHKCL